MSPFRSACIVRRTCQTLACCGWRVSDIEVLRWTPEERTAVMAWADAYLIAAYSDADLPVPPVVLATAVDAAPMLGHRPHGAGLAPPVGEAAASPMWRRA